ncbi:protease modulator HflC [Acetivibrio clariflavus]|uniref:Protein HflC n=1 Tax=Acetivibrio clariflavus (strain DSM 19732 / NBRC 101661 / EBR45) TaxID=720554 RepID=G8M1C8_ACECE|nr:protease modulator HflC [Acetivibrio clariflavus]AEV68104.1 membrane protease subunit, stomatin/prohibitin [Acetivibrio clariflavus DSM 19732]HOP99458.1 protease modulator HflC [Acetivibrio clariflavus]HPU42363.1 protease modulator HflC [Acetivibrio clariflavus]
MKKIVIPVVVFLTLILILTGAYIVKEDEYACIKRFGKVIDIKDSAGLYFKVPFLDSKFELPKKKILYDLQPSNVLTEDKKAMVVDNYVVWKISDPLEFYKSVGLVSEAEKRIDAAVYNAVKNTMGTLKQNSIINEKLSARGEFNATVKEEVANQIKHYGIDIIDVKIKKLDLPIENEESVYKRMISEREKIAEQFIAEGEYEAQKIKNEVDKEVAILISQAKAKEQELLGEGEAEYMKILADAYSGEKMEFYEFIRSLEAMKTSLKGEKTLVLPLDSPITKYLISDK